MGSKLSGWESYVQANSKRNPTHRLGSCKEIGQMACYLASEAGDYITGQMLCVDGGRSLWGKHGIVPDPAELPEIEVPSYFGNRRISC